MKYISNYTSKVYDCEAIINSFYSFFVNIKSDLVHTCGGILYIHFFFWGHGILYILNHAIYHCLNELQCHVILNILFIKKTQWGRGNFINKSDINDHITVTTLLGGIQTLEVIKLSSKSNLSCEIFQITILFIFSLPYQNNGPLFKIICPKMIRFNFQCNIDYLFSFQMYL